MLDQSVNIRRILLFHQITKENTAVILPHSPNIGGTGSCTNAKAHGAAVRNTGSVLLCFRLFGGDGLFLLAGSADLSDQHEKIDYKADDGKGNTDNV